MATNNKKIRHNLILLGILILQILLMVYFGTQKAGFHQDEYYSFFSTNRTLGFYYPDREWQSAETIRNEFTVLKGEGFNYGLVKLVQSWDVHPPLYYWILHTVCSVFYGTFSKWIGIGINLVAFVLSFILLYMLSRSIGMNRELRTLTLTIYGFNPMTISCVLFIRMYMWLTVFVLASAFLHMKLINLIKRYYKEKGNGGFELSKPFDKIFVIKFAQGLGVLMCVNFLGFLTQYYYLIFAVMMGFNFSIWFLFLMPKKRPAKNDKAGEQPAVDEKVIATLFERIKYTLVYVLGNAISFAAGVAVYPASLSHIFRGYRGQEAAEAFSDASNIGLRLDFFIGLADKYLFSGFGPVILVLMLISGVGLLFFIRVKKEKDSLHISNVRVLFVTTVAYFLLVAKTALLLGDTSNRYEMPVYPIMLLLAIYFTRVGVRTIVGNRNIGKFSIPVIITVIIFALVDIRGLASDGNVLFLYREDESRVETARQAAADNIPVVILFNDATPDNVYRLTNELLEYPELFYVNESNLEMIKDEKINSASEVFVYAADHDNRDQLINVIIDGNPSITSSEIISTKDMWTLYRLY